MTKFAIPTPLGFTVRTTESYWKLLLLKHPEVAGREQDIQEALTSPDRVCRSRHDSRVYLFYRTQGDYYMCVVVKRLNGEGFLVTAYMTDTIKEGEHLWPISE